MNVFRIAGDSSHLIAIAILIVNIWRTRSCAGLSGKSQLLYAFVFTSRYLDLIYFISIYNTIMKMIVKAIIMANKWITFFFMMLTE
ncbi:unnamed protein product, partial [Onchocerca flexuosa]|uniref:ER lumen protein-retaining receptor n=1 Tax=Onchocerca flexuosa TaxID=387005 RepID=A0A183I0I1_9BILA